MKTKGYCYIMITKVVSTDHILKIRLAISREKLTLFIIKIIHKNLILDLLHENETVHITVYQ